MVKEKPKAQLSPLNDVVFRELFGDEKSKEITKEVIEDVLGEKINIIELDKNPNLFGRRAKDKLGIVDVRAEINGKQQVDIELQRAKQENFAERILFYWARMYEKQMSKGKKYDVLQRCIIIAFVNYEIDLLKELPLNTKWQVREEKYGEKVLTDRLEIHIINLLKVRENKGNTAISIWAEFLKKPYGEAITKMSKTKTGVKKALERLEELNADEAMITEAELVEKQMLDYNSGLSTARNEGIRERN